MRLTPVGRPHCVGRAFPRPPDTVPSLLEEMRDMATNIEQRSDPTNDESWAFEPGTEITPQREAIALLGDGVRTETWLAWDTFRWAPVVVKIARPDHIE